MAHENTTCERAFSVMQFIKNDHRSCLTQLHLENALGIAIHEKPASNKFPFEEQLKNNDMTLSIYCNHWNIIS